MLGVAPPAAPNKTQTYTIVLTVADGNGGEATDFVNLTVTDMTGPVLHGVPSGIVAASASGPAGTSVTYGPVTAIDAVDGARAVSCSPASSSVFPVGDTTVTCSSTDTRANSTTAGFTVRVSAAQDRGTPGKMYGYGFIVNNDLRYEFAFAVKESPSGVERGAFYLRVKSAHRNIRGRRVAQRDDYGVAQSVDSIAFSDDPTVRTGRRPRPQVDTVLFSGVCRWNGHDGYRYKVFAVDSAQPGRRHHESVRMTITAPGGDVVAHVDGELTGGNIQSVRIRH